MKSVIKKIAMFSILISIIGNTSLLNSSGNDQNRHKTNSAEPVRFDEILMNEAVKTKPVITVQPKPIKKPDHLMNEPVKEKPVNSVQIKVVNVPVDHFIAAGVLNHNAGETNYSMQPNTNGTYTFYSDHYYAAAANDRKSFKNQRKGSDFIGKTKWDVGNNIVS